MRVIGQRADGAYHLSLGRGLSVILRGELTSKAVDETVVERLGPWTSPTPEINALAERRRLTAKLELARVVPVETLQLVRWSYTPDQMRQFHALVNDSPSALKALADEPTADKDEHPFTYCMRVVIPAMERDGKAPSDPEAFCGWFKHYGPGSE